MFFVEFWCLKSTEYTMMRFICLVIFCLSANISATAQTEDCMSFDTRLIELGEVQHGEKREGVFKFKNNLNVEMEIDIVDACECTTLEWTRSAIAPGEYGEISFVFDSAQKEESETISVDITLKNEDPKTGGPVMDFVEYTYVLKK